MKKVKLEKNEKDQDVIPSTIEHFYKYMPLDEKGNSKGAGIPMVKIKGNFFRGGFNLSKNKVKAIIDNIELLQKFANGEFDKEINELNFDEVIQP